MYLPNFSNLNLEIVIIEDNSPDKTREMAKKLIKFYHKTSDSIANEFSIVFCLLSKVLVER